MGIIKKKHSVPKKEEPKSGQEVLNYWDAPPEVPVQNIRRMLTSLEKELELLAGSNDLKKTNETGLAVPIALPAVTVQPNNTSPQRKDINPPKELAEAVQKAVGRAVVNTNRRKDSAPYSSISVGRQIMPLPPPSISSLRKSPSTSRVSSYSFDRYKSYKSKVLQAYQNRKIFMVHGHYGEVKAALHSRGWIEKLPYDSHRGLQQMSQHNLLMNAKNQNEYEVVLLSRMLENYPAYFIWQPKGMYDYYNYAMPFRNRIRLRGDLDFTTKEGLIACVNRAQERGILGAGSTIHPRTFRLAYNNEISSFERNFRITCCSNLLLFISEREKTSDVFSPTGEVNLQCLEFALFRIQKELSIKKGAPSDIAEYASITTAEWTTFLTDSAKIIQKNNKIRCSASDETIYMNKVRSVIADVRKTWPNFKMDGYANVWILKPANHCRGYGIVLMTQLDRILNQARSHYKFRYIAQKYIERPLLIYRTKFDIRQYVLVTIRDSITIYMYMDCYVKFSSQEFNLTNLHESVHVTNFAVQSKYKNGERSEHLPPHNMWSLLELKNYFKSIKKDNIWETLIFPRMVDTVVSTMMASYESADLVTNAFEMYGLDFMLTEDFEPVLLEVNATPDLVHSTCVTARICPAAVRDLVKVVVDLPSNPRANIGNFKPVYKVNWTRGANNKPVIHQYTNAFNLAKSKSPQSPSNSSRINFPNRSATGRIQQARKKPVQQNFTRKTPPPKTKPTPVTRMKKETSSQQNTKITNAFVKKFADTIETSKRNLSKKEAMGKQVFRAIEALYKMKPTPEFHLFKASKSGDKKGKSSVFENERLLKQLGQALYNKIWH